MHEFPVSDSQTKRNYRVATDIGGTYTDIVTFNTVTQDIEFLKVHSTPPNFEQGIMDALKKTNIRIEDVHHMVHGATVVINALTERKGVKTGLITTEGFRDILEIGRGNRPDFFNLNYQKPTPFIPRYLRQEIPGRISYQGHEIIPLDLTILPKILSIFREENVQAIAVCLINSYANSDHEKLVLNAIREQWADVTLVGSYEITRECREYERTNTTVLSAYVKPITQAYLAKLTSLLNNKSFQGKLEMMQSNGGVGSVESSCKVPITMIESGPAGGVQGAAALGKLIDRNNIIALDVGGTTAKTSLIHEGQVPVNTDYHIERNLISPGYPIMVPVVDIVEIGNGGGSIAWFDEFHQLFVGPQSAGARPGPVAYDNGGNNLTTTDALLYLGRINPGEICGQSSAANMQAIKVIAKQLSAAHNFSTEDLMRGIIRIANHNMTKALKLISVNRGYDPRDFSLVAFGGGGGLHGCELAKELGIKEVIIPKASAVFSAWGMLICDLRRDFIQTKIIFFSESNAKELLTTELKNIEESIYGNFANENITKCDIRLEHYGRFRYQNQEHFVEIKLPVDLSGTENLDKMINDFHAAYESKYSYCLKNCPVELICFHTVAFVTVDKLNLKGRRLSEQPIEKALKHTRLVDYLNMGCHLSPVYDATLLEPGMSFIGPAIVESSSCSIVILPTLPATVDAYGNLQISMQSQATFTKQISDDPITIEIIQSTLQAISEEMFAAMRRTAMSPIIYEVLDMGTAIISAKGELTSSGAGIPWFINMLDKSIKYILEKYNKANSILSGDIFIVNHPYYGGITHLNDVVLAMPVFSESDLIAWTANIAHWSDVGGMSPGSITTEAKELMQEGLIIPPLKIFSNGILNEAVFELICANSRMPDFLKGDFWAGIAAARVGERAIQELLKKYGKHYFLLAINQYLLHAEQLTMHGLRKLQSGVYTFAEEQDDDQTFQVTITIQNDKFIVDLTKNPNQQDKPINISRDAAVVSIEAIFKSLIAPSSVCNAGSFRPLKVLTRKGSIFDPHYPAPMGIYYETMIRLHDLIWRTLAKYYPNILPAGSFASICGTLFGGKHPDTGRDYTVVEPELGGWGASSEHDGNSALFSGIHGNTYNCPAEISEARNGIRVNRYSFHNQSGGNGKFRGGKGVCIEYEILSEKAWLTALYTRFKVKPWPLAGGEAGSSNCIEVNYKSGKKEQHAEVSGLPLEKGDVIRILTGTGAGWGDPADRNVDSVIDDLKNGYITESDATQLYKLDKRSSSFWARITEDKRKQIDRNDKACGKMQEYPSISPAK